jgi:hypothetical protein
MGFLGTGLPAPRPRPTPTATRPSPSVDFSAREPIPQRRQGPRPPRPCPAPPAAGGGAPLSSAVSSSMSRCSARLQEPVRVAPCLEPAHTTAARLPLSASRLGLRLRHAVRLPRATVRGAPDLGYWVLRMVMDRVDGPAFGCWFGWASECYMWVGGGKTT